MTQGKATLRYKQLGEAFGQLKEAVLKPENTYGKGDIVIQRFEFTVELFWKVLKYALEQKKVEAPFPKVRLQKAFAAGWIDDEEMWLRILDDRNLTSHVYDSKMAAAIAARITTYLPAMEVLYKKLKDILEEEK